MNRVILIGNLGKDGQQQELADARVIIESGQIRLEGGAA